MKFSKKKKPNAKNLLTDVISIYSNIKCLDLIAHQNMIYFH